MTSNKGSEGKKKGSQEFIDISEEDDDEISPLPKGAAGEWTTEKKQVNFKTLFHNVKI